MNKVWWVLLGVMVLRLLYLPLSGLDLTPDEAYYWNWSQHLDWCYYSKPPMIAWINALSTGLLGVTTFAVRLPAVLLGTGTLALVCLTARQLYGERSAWLALLLLLATPANVAMNFVMTIDSPLAFGWSLALWGVSRAMLTPDKRLRWWLLGGLGAMIALLSKQMGIFLVLLPLLSWLALREKPTAMGRGWLAVVGGAVVAALPILLWNAHHGWIMFQHTSGHFEATPWTPAEILNTLPEFLGSQLGLLNPLACIVLGALLWLSLRQWRSLPDRERWLMVWGGLPLLVFIALAFKQRVHPNWPLVFYLPMFVMLSGFFAGGIQTWAAHRMRHWLQPTLVTGAVLVGLCYLLPPTLPRLGQAGGKIDAMHRARGWQELAEQVQAIRQEHDIAELAIVAESSRHPVDALTFYLPEHPRVYRWSRRGYIHTQHELWPGPQAHFGQKVLVFADRDLLEPTQADAFAEFRACFGSLQELDTTRVDIGPSRQRTYWLYIGNKLQNWQQLPGQ